MPSKPLPPLDTDAFDGEKQSAEIPRVIPKCAHSDVSFVNGELRCPRCNSAWSGPNLHILYNHLHKS